MKFKNILFDLDGTLTDPFEGITNAVSYALGKMSLPIPPKQTLRRFIGPPLVVSFSSFCGLDEENAQLAVRYYREYYSEKGVLENTLFDGVPELIGRLKEAGCRVMLATSKPESFACRILEHFDLMKYFDFVSAPTLSDLHSEKKDIIGRAIERYDLGKEKDSCLMIGDRYFDIEGAHLCGIKAVGVLWGYGGRKEFEEYHAEFVAESVENLEKLINDTEI